jgi:hypothetical protein
VVLGNYFSPSFFDAPHAVGLRLYVAVLASGAATTEPAVRRRADRRHAAGWAALAVLTSLLYALPLLIMLAYGVSPVSVVTESLGYRYFNSLRLLEGERGLIFIVQGQTPGLVQHLISLAMSAAGLPIESLRPRLDLFSYSFSFLNAALMAWVICAALMGSTLRGSDKLLIVTSALAGGFVSRSAISASMTPDYYAVESTMSTLGLWLFLRQVRAPAATVSLRTIALYGVLAGLMAGTKINLFWIGLVAALPAVLGPSFSPVRTIARGVLLGAVAVAVFMLVTVAFYLFDLRLMPEFLARWLELVRNPATLSQEERFWTSLFFPGSPGANPGADYGYARILFVAWLAALLGSLIAELRRSPRRPEPLLIILGVTLFGLWQVIGLVVRPAGTTLFEVGLYAVASGAAVIALLSHGRVQRWLAYGFAGVILLQTIVSGVLNVPVLIPGPTLRQSSDVVWDVHTWLRTLDRDVLVFLPDNRYAGGTVEESLLKGMSDLPTWNITAGKVLLARLAPRFTFSQSWQEVRPGGAVMWLDSPEAPDLAVETPGLRSLLADPTTACRHWALDTYPWWRHTVHACTRG